MLMFTTVVVPWAVSAFMDALMGV